MVRDGFVKLPACLDDLMEDEIDDAEERLTARRNRAWIRETLIRLHERPED